MTRSCNSSRCATILAALAALAAPAGGARAQAPVPAGAPLASIDLATPQGVGAVGGEWRFAEARVVEAAFRSAGPDLKPSGPPNVTYDVTPRAGGVDFDDGAFAVLDPTTLFHRRGTGRVCFAWYRLAVTLPERVGEVSVAGTTAVFQIVVDDYAEVWVDGALPRALGQTGGSMVAGFNVQNRVVVSADARPGQRIQLAVFAMNGPISDPPANFIWVRSAQLEFHAPAPAVGIERVDPAFDDLVAEDATMERVADGLAWVEGPVWHPEGFLLFTDIPANAVLQWRPGHGVRPYLVPAGYSGQAPFPGREPGANGLALDASGRLVLCEHGDRRLTRLEADFTRTVLADRYGGRRLNSPNDVVFAPDGSLCFTDPPFGLPGTFVDPGRELGFCGVYRVSGHGTGGGRVRLLTDEVQAPNGLAFSPDGRTLFVSDADPAQPRWLAFPVLEDGSVGDSRTFFDASRWVPQRPGGADGIKVDRAGNLFTAGPGGVYVLAPDGRHLGTLLTGSATSNCCFGEDGHSLFITAGHAVWRVRVRTRAAS